MTVYLTKSRNKVPEWIMRPIKWRTLYSTQFTRPARKDRKTIKRDLFLYCRRRQEAGKVLPLRSKSWWNSVLHAFVSIKDSLDNLYIIFMSGDEYKVVAARGIRNYRERKKEIVCMWFFLLENQQGFRANFVTVGNYSLPHHFELQIAF